MSQLKPSHWVQKCLLYSYENKLISVFGVVSSEQQSRLIWLWIKQPLQSVVQTMSHVIEGIKLYWVNLDSVVVKQVYSASDLMSSLLLSLCPSPMSPCILSASHLCPFDVFIDYWKLKSTNSVNKLYNLKVTCNVEYQFSIPLTLTRSTQQKTQQSDKMRIVRSI